MFQTTRNYDQFKKIDGNRAIDKYLVRSLVKEFKKQGFLDDFPLLVTRQGSHFAVLDGQHRLEAAKSLGLAVKYRISDLGKDVIPTINSISKKWIPDDFVNFFASEGIESYQIIQNLSRQYNIKCHSVVAMMGVNPRATGSVLHGGNSSRKLRTGKFECTSKEVSNFHKNMIHVDAIRFYSPHYESFSNQGSFLKALIELVTFDGYDHDQMLSSLSLCQTRLVKCTNIRAYKKLLADIYNYKRKKRVSL